MRKNEKFGPFRPVINDPIERERAIKNNDPAIFEIREERRNDGSKLWDSVRTFESWGADAVRENDKAISEHAKKENIDPDLVRAVIFSENSRGHYMGLNSGFQSLGIAESLLPMNIQNHRWAELIDKNPEDLYNSEDNIEAGTVLLSRIRNRIESPTAEKIGTLWNNLKAKETNEFGEYVEEVYRKKPWKKFED